MALNSNDERENHIITKVLSFDIWFVTYKNNFMIFTLKTWKKKKKVRRFDHSTGVEWLDSASRRHSHFLDFGTECDWRLTSQSCRTRKNGMQIQYSDFVREWNCPLAMTGQTLEKLTGYSFHKKPSLIHLKCPKIPRVASKCRKQNLTFCSLIGQVRIRSSDQYSPDTFS